MEYNFKEIEQKWQHYWIENATYKVEVDQTRPKYYVLDMFPYPSGAGLHVGHPLGYIASDIYSRYKRLKGFNVLHPMGYDAYGLPAEQYAIQTGQHPEVTTKKNITRYREQMDKIGFCYDWSREIRTCEPNYYKWTQWAFIQMFNRWYCQRTNAAQPISELVALFTKEGNANIRAAQSEIPVFTAEEWNNWDEKKQQEVLMAYRIAYLADLKVNWCPALGTVLANDEVSEGLSVRGGHPVEQRIMRQWSLRVSAYAQRLLDGLDQLDWTESLKETQKNWIGRSEGAQLFFGLANSDAKIEIFTTRADTVFGVTFMVLAPESDYVAQLVTPAQKAEVEAYLDRVKRRTERERIADRKVTGVFSGAYAINPLTNNQIPIYISDYVLAGYGTGAIMAVPAHDSRDYAFAKHFDLPIIPLIEGCDVSEESYDAKEGVMTNSGFLNGKTVKEAIAAMKTYIAEHNLGQVKVNYRLRDAIFSRQRYWGEPFPVYYKEGMPYVLDESKLPLELPEIDKYLPTESGEPPLGRAQNWKTDDGYPLELNTMPGFAGSSAYYLRYMDPHNTEALVGKLANSYWQNVDLYIGGTEHATGHLIYSRFWNKFLFDLGVIVKDEPFQKLINQGMIQGRSNFGYRLFATNLFFSYNDYVTFSNKQEQAKTRNEYLNLICEVQNFVKSFVNPEDLSSNAFLNEDLADSSIDYSTKILFQPMRIPVEYVSNDVLDVNSLKEKTNIKDLQIATFIPENAQKDGKYVCGWAVEKMSKSMFNVVNPDDIVEKYGADTLRLYEMFLGPLEQSKPWDTNGIDGVHRFLKKLWSLFYKEDTLLVTNETPTAEELKTLHKTIKKIAYDIENFSFNTSVSAFMICVNELATLKCTKRDILEPLLILLAPFAPHITEELWHTLGHTNSICDATFPLCNEAYLVETSVKYPISFNGKVRFILELPADMSKEEVEKTALANEQTAKFLEGKQPKKVIVVPGKIVNIVI